MWACVCACVCACMCACVCACVCACMQVIHYGVYLACTCTYTHAHTLKHAHTCSLSPQPNIIIIIFHSQFYLKVRSYIASEPSSRNKQRGIYSLSLLMKSRNSWSSVSFCSTCRRAARLEVMRGSRLPHSYNHNAGITVFWPEIMCKALCINWNKIFHWFISL